LLRGSAVAGIGLAGVGLVGCGDDDDDDATPTSSGGQTPSASPTSSVLQPKQGGTFRESTTSPPTAWDPYVNSSFSAQEPYAHFSARLLKYMADEMHGPSDLSVEGDVCESLPEQPDASTMVLKLRQGIKYHDKPPVNGRVMTAEDVKFSLERYKSMGNNKSQLNAITSIDVTDDHTIKLTLGTPTASLISSLADSVLVWLIAPEVGQNEIAATDPKVGVGPFMFDSYQTDVQMNYVRHPDYFLNPMPYFDRIERPIITEEATQDSNFRSGNLDRLAVPEKNRVEELLKSVKDSTSLNYFSWSMARIDMAMHQPPFDDIDMRRAMSMSFDRDEIGAALDSLDYKWASHAFGAGYTPWFIDPQSSDFGENAKYFQYNPTEAKAIVDAKYPGGVEVPYILTPDYAGALVMGEYLADKLAKVGVTLKIESYTYTEYQNKYRAPKTLDERLFSGMIDERFASRADPTGWFLVYHSPSASRMMMKYSDPEFEQMIADQEVELDLEARVEKVHEIQRHMAGTMAGFPLISEAGADLNQPRLKNFIYKLDVGRTAEGHIKAWLDV